MVTRSDQTADRSGRFEFGQNWQSFRPLVDETRVRMAEESLREMLGVRDLSSSTFVDIGSGSGLFSLAAMRMGARSVRSFDVDSDSVASTLKLRAEHFPETDRWIVER